MNIIIHGRLSYEASLHGLGNNNKYECAGENLKKKNPDLF